MFTRMYVSVLLCLAAGACSDTDTPSTDGITDSAETDDAVADSSSPEESRPVAYLYGNAWFTWSGPDQTFDSDALHDPVRPAVGIQINLLDASFGGATTPEERAASMICTLVDIHGLKGITWRDEAALPSLDLHSLDYEYSALDPSTDCRDVLTGTDLASLELLLSDTFEISIDDVPHPYLRDFLQEEKLRNTFAGPSVSESADTAGGSAGWSEVDASDLDPEDLFLGASVRVGSRELPGGYVAAQLLDDEGIVEAGGSAVLQTRERFEREDGSLDDGFYKALISVGWEQLVLLTGEQGGY